MDWFKSKQTSDKLMNKTCVNLGQCPIILDILKTSSTTSKSVAAERESWRQKIPSYVFTICANNFAAMATYFKWCDECRWWNWKIDKIAHQMNDCEWTIFRHKFYANIC